MCVCVCVCVWMYVCACVRRGREEESKTEAIQVKQWAIILTLKSHYRHYYKCLFPTVLTYGHITYGPLSIFMRVYVIDR